MFSTSLAALAVTGLLASGNLVTVPAVQTDYRTALALATEQHKPMAVFIATGNAGYTRLVNDSVGNDVTQLLRQNYVCLFVDTTTDSGKALAGSFEMTEGIVISDHSAGLQALRHEGTVNQADLKGYLERFRTTTKVVRTEMRSALGAIAPALAPQAGYNPYPVFPGLRTSGGCPNGRCPNAR